MCGVCMFVCKGHAKCLFKQKNIMSYYIWIFSFLCRYQRAKDVLVWATAHMEVATWSREDYRELVELVVIFLGGDVKRVYKNVPTIVSPTIRKPGACHRARFMASSLYLLKICLYKKQFKTSKENLLHADILGEYIVLLHAPYFLQSPLAISAPRQDRDFWTDMQNYQKCFEADELQYLMSQAVLDSVKNHLWYLTEELVVFALFDKNLSDEERSNMAKRLLEIPRPDNFKLGKPIFPVEKMSVRPTLESFIGQRSWLLFHKLNADGDWLRLEIFHWSQHDEYERMRLFLSDLKVVNDLAERCIKDIQEYADIAKDSTYRDAILLVASDHRGVFQDLRKQSLR